MLLLAASVAGCGAGEGSEPRGSRAAALDGAAPAPSASVRIALELEPSTQGPVFVLLDRSDAQPGWVEVSRDGEAVHLLERCDIRDCGVPAAVCGMAIPTVVDVASRRGRRVEVMWDGRTSVLDPESGCERREPAPPGEYVARFCYARRGAAGPAALAPGLPGEGRVVDPTCVERRFSTADASVVLRL